MNIERDAEGYLVNPDEWSQGLAEQLAQEENVEMNEHTWAVIDFIRDYYADHHTAVDVRHVITHLASEHDMDKKKAKQLIFTLFPHGYVKQACKIAGMKKPRAWSTG